MFQTLVKVRFDSKGKAYTYFCPDHLKDKVKKGAYVIVPEKNKNIELRYKTAQCVEVKTYDSSAIPEYVYESIVDVVCSDKYEDMQYKLKRGQELEEIFQALYSYADKYQGNVLTSMEVVKDFGAPDAYQWKIILHDPIGKGFMCPKYSKVSDTVMTFIH